MVKNGVLKKRYGKFIKKKTYEPLTIKTELEAWQKKWITKVSACHHPLWRVCN